MLITKYRILKPVIPLETMQPQLREICFIINKEKDSEDIVTLSDILKTYLKSFPTSGKKTVYTYIAQLMAFGYIERILKGKSKAEQVDARILKKINKIKDLYAKLPIEDQQTLNLI